MAGGIERGEVVAIQKRPVAEAPKLSRADRVVLTTSARPLLGSRLRQMRL